VHQVEVKLSAAARDEAVVLGVDLCLVNPELDVGGCESVGLPDLLDLPPLVVSLLGDVLDLSLLLQQLSLSLFHILPEKLEFFLGREGVSLFLVLLFLDELQPFHVKRDHRQRRPPLVLLVELPQLDGQFVLLGEELRVLQ